MAAWINFRDYTEIQLAFNGLGCFFWLLAYAVLVGRIFKNRFVEMPALVAGANFGWEIVWSVCFHPTTGRLFSLMYIGAVILDVYIFFSLLRWGRRQLLQPVSPAVFRTLCVANVVFWGALCYFARAEGLDDPLGARSGYVINVVLSYTSLMLMRRFEGSFSVWLGIFRLLGTGLISVSVALIYPDSRWLQLLGVACALLDGVFVARLLRRRSVQATPARAAA